MCGIPAFPPCFLHLFKCSGLLSCKYLDVCLDLVCEILPDAGIIYLISSFPPSLQFIEFLKFFYALIKPESEDGGVELVQSLCVLGQGGW